MTLKLPSSTIGLIGFSKTDYEVIHTRGVIMSFKIVSDSASNIFTLPDVAYANVPMKIITKDKEYVDTPDLDLENMIIELKNNKGGSSTSCPNIYDWCEAFKGGDKIFAVTITSNLSGSCTSATQAAADYMEEHPNAKVTVLDSLSAGAEMGLIIEKLQELINKKLSFEDIENAVREYMKHTHLLFSLESLTNLVRNGRTSPTVAAIAGVLGIRFVGKASDVGTLEPIHKCRGEKKVLHTLLNSMKELGFNGGKVRISQCYNPNAADKLKDMIMSEFPTSKIIIESCTALCSFYAEHGGLLVGFEDANA